MYTVTRHAQTRTWGVQSQLQLRVLFSADLWMGEKNSKFERSNRSHTKPLVHHGFSHSLVFWKELTVYLRSCNLCLQFETSEKKKIQIKKRNSRGKAGLKSKSTFHAWIPTFFWNEPVRTFPIISPLLFRELWIEKKNLKFERKSTSYRKPLQNHSCFLSQPFSKEDKGIFMIILFQRTIFLDVRTSKKKLEILLGR